MFIKEYKCVGAIANRGQWEQGCSLFMATDLGPVRATRREKKKLNLKNLNIKSQYLNFTGYNKRDGPIRLKSDDQINKNHMTKYFLPYYRINRY